MGKLFLVLCLIAGSLLGAEWIPIAKQSLDVNKECLIYDAWNDRVVFCVPHDYIRWEYHNERVVVITHWMPLERPYDVHVHLDEVLK